MEIGIQSGDLRLVGNDVQANATAFSRAVVGTDASVRAFNNKGVAKYGFSNELETLVHVVIDDTMVCQSAIIGTYCSPTMI